MRAPLPLRALPPVFSRTVLEDELGRVHARAFARLLAQASWLRAQCVPRLRELEGVLDLAGWRREGCIARQLAGVDGYELPGLLRRCLANELARWPAQARLAREAFELSPAEARRWQVQPDRARPESEEC